MSSVKGKKSTYFQMALDNLLGIISKEERDFQVEDLVEAIRKSFTYKQIDIIRNGLIIKTHVNIQRKGKKTGGRS